MLHLEPKHYYAHMNTQEAVAQFVALHSSGTLARPASFDEKKATARFESVVQELERQFQGPCTPEDGIQDASFFAEVGLPRASFDDVVLLRFSTFGDMVAIRDESELDEEQLKNIEKILTRHGFILIPESAFAVPYEKEFAEKFHHSWWYRYFDYL